MFVFFPALRTVFHRSNSCPVHLPWNAFLTIFCLYFWRCVHAQARSHTLQTIVWTNNFLEDPLPPRGPLSRANGQWPKQWHAMNILTAYSDIIRLKIERTTRSLSSFNYSCSEKLQTYNIWHECNECNYEWMNSWNECKSYYQRSQNSVAKMRLGLLSNDRIHNRSRLKWWGDGILFSHLIDTQDMDIGPFFKSNPT